MIPRKTRLSKSVLCLSTRAFKSSLECQHGLLDHLLQNGCLTAEQVRNLREGYNTEISRNNGLIDLINLSNIDKFEQGLEASNQSHLVNFIRSNGKKTPGDSDDWPLRDSDISPIINSYPDLVAHIFSNDLIDQLFAKKCLTTEQKNSILTKSTTEEKNRELLGIVMRRSVRQLDIFYQCLQIHHQDMYENLLLKRSKETTASAIGAERILFIVELVSTDDSLVITTEPKSVEISLDKPDTINVISSTPTFLGNACAFCVVVSNVLYAVGIGKDEKELWKWSASSDEWARCADMPSGRRNHCATSVGDKIYVLGGLNDAELKVLDSILCYDINSNDWTQAGKLRHAVEDNACATYKHYAYSFGGRGKNYGEIVNYVQIYNTVTRSVSLGSIPMPNAHNGMRAAVYGTKALLFGRETCYIYDFEFNTWQKRKRFKTDVFIFGLTLDDNILYISGGYTCISAGVWTCSDKVKSLLVDDFILDNKDAEWKHHATLPIPGTTHLCNNVTLFK